MAFIRNKNLFFFIPYNWLISLGVEFQPLKRSGWPDQLTGFGLYNYYTFEILFSCRLSMIHMYEHPNPTSEGVYYTILHWFLVISNPRKHIILQPTVTMRAFLKHWSNVRPFELITYLQLIIRLWPKLLSQRCRFVRLAASIA